MPTLTLKQLPTELLERLRDDALRERRSLNQHAIHLLEEALGSRRPGFAEAYRDFLASNGPPEEANHAALQGLRSSDEGRKVVL